MRDLRNGVQIQKKRREAEEFEEEELQLRNR